MNMKHQAIFELYNNVVKVTGSGDGVVAHDINGNVVSWDAAAVSNKEVEILAEFRLTELRTERNRLLAETDWWDMSDTATMTDAQKKYRQDLRDITNTYKNLDDVSWPTKPS